MGSIYSDASKKTQSDAKIWNLNAFITLKIYVQPSPLRQTLLKFHIFCIIHQVVCCVSSPIPYKNPLRKLFFNVGFQFNYGEPFALANFYNATYYQNIFNGRDFKDSHFSSADNSTENNDQHLLYNATNDGTTVVNDVKDHMKSRSIDGSNDLVGKDLTATQLYESIEDNFVE